jgi:hypothetical protein
MFQIAHYLCTVAAAHSSLHVCVTMSVLRDVAVVVIAAGPLTIHWLVHSSLNWPALLLLWHQELSVVSTMHTTPSLNICTFCTHAHYAAAQFTHTFVLCL